MHQKAPGSHWLSGGFVLQLPIVGGVDRNGAQQVAVSFLVSAVTQVELLHDILDAPMLKVAHPEQTGTDGVGLVIVTQCLLNGQAPAAALECLAVSPLAVAGQGAAGSAAAVS